MVLEVTIDGSSVTLQIDKPFQPEFEAMMTGIEQLAASKGADIAALDIGTLILEMIRGIAGCESGCPANAKSLISRGYKGFDLRYVEGGILTARSNTGDGSVLQLKMFPDF